MLSRALPSRIGSEPAIRRRTAAFVVGGAVLLAVFTASYRFNTLGGALGGFDDDHFVHFVYAKQVQAGEQPLRDFDGLGLQGAPPSLTYRASAAAQSILGDTFRSEALLTVSALAIAAALTFHAAARLAPAAWALTATLLTVLLAPKLYTYPKVLLLAAAVACIVSYARRRSLGGVAAMAVLTAVAFLFRHDYAAYVGVGAAAVLAAAAGGARRRVGHLVAYGATVGLLLAPSLWYVQRQAGLIEYFRGGLEQSRNEASRTELRRPGFVSVNGEGEAVTPLTALAVEQNAVAWLYYLHMGLPVLVLAMLLRRRRDEPACSRPAIFAIGVSALFAYPLLLRGNVGARLGEVGPLTSVIGAVVLARAFHGIRWKPDTTPGQTRSWIWRAAGAATASAILVAAVASIWTVGSVRSELDAAGWSDSLEKIAAQARRRWTDLAQLPGASWSGPQPSASLLAAQYLNRCTAPDDRIVVMSYQPEILALADRRFGAGRAAVLPDLLSDDAHERVVLERWRAQRVPIVLTEPLDDYEQDYPAQFALLDGYLQEAYVEAGTLDVDGGELRVLRDSRIPVVGAFGEDELPCFR